MRQRPVWTTNVAGFAIGFAMFGSFVLIPQFVQTPSVGRLRVRRVGHASRGSSCCPRRCSCSSPARSAGAWARATARACRSRSGALSSGLSYAWLAAFHDARIDIYLGERPARPRRRARAGGDGQPRRRGRAARRDRRGQRHQRDHAHRSAAPIGAQVAAAIVSASLVEGARFPAESGFTGAFAMSARRRRSSRCSSCFAIPARARRARRAARRRRRRREARVSDDDRLSPEIVRVAIVVDRRGDHVDPRHLDRQRRARVAVAATSTRRCRRSSGWPAATCSRWPRVIPLTGWAAERFGPRRVWMTMVAAFVATSALCGAGLERRVAHRLPRPAGPRGRDDHADRDDHPGPGGRAAAHRARHERRRRADAARAGARPGPRRRCSSRTCRWRWIFFVNLPIGLVGLVLAARLLPGGARRGTRGGGPGRLDWRGLLLLSPGVALVVFGLSEVSTHGSVTVRAAAAGARGRGARRRLRRCARGARRRRSSTCGCSRSAASRRPARRSSSSAPRSSARCCCCRSTSRSARGLSPLDAGLLMAPQGLGAALGMNRAGRLTDRIGGGPVVLAGLLGADARHDRLHAGRRRHALLAARGRRSSCAGVGLGFTMMPAMAAAYATLERWQVPRATPMLNVVQRVGGSLGTAVLAVVLAAPARRTPAAAARAPWRPASGTPTGGRWRSPPSRWCRRSCWRAPSAPGGGRARRRRCRPVG